MYKFINKKAIEKRNTGRFARVLDDIFSSGYGKRFPHSIRILFVLVVVGGDCRENDSNIRKVVNQRAPTRYARILGPRNNDKDQADVIRG